MSERENKPETGDTPPDGAIGDDQLIEHLARLLARRWLSTMDGEEGARRSPPDEPQDGVVAQLAKGAGSRQEPPPPAGGGRALRDNQ